MTSNYAPFLHNVDAPDHGRALRVTATAVAGEVSIAAGRFRIDQTVTNRPAATTFPPAPPLGNGVNYIHITAAGAIATVVGGPYPANSIPLALVTVVAGVITGITDERCFFYEDTGGDGGAPHNLLDGATHPDTVAQVVSKGSLVAGNATPAWDELPAGPNNAILLPDSTQTLGLRWAGGLYLYGPAAGMWQLQAIGPANMAATLAIIPKLTGTPTGSWGYLDIYASDYIADTVNYARHRTRVYNSGADDPTAFFELETAGTYGPAIGWQFNADGIQLFKMSAGSPQGLYGFSLGGLNAGNSDLSGIHIIYLEPRDSATYRQFDYTPMNNGVLELKGVVSTVTLKRPPSAGLAFYNRWWSTAHGHSHWQQFLNFVRGYADPAAAAPNSEVIWKQQYEGIGAPVDVFGFRQSGELLLLEATTPTVFPAAGYNLLYLKADGKLYRLNSAGTEAEVGAGMAQHGDEYHMGRIEDGGAALPGSGEDGELFYLTTDQHAYLYNT